MKTYKVTVDGQEFEITVEEVTKTFQRPVSLPTAPMPTPPPPVSTPTNAPVPTAPATPAQPAVSGTEGVAVQAPMPGKILNVKVAEGASVRSGDILLILEAMKMENDIMATVNGTVKSVNVGVGDSVNTGDVLLVIG